MEDYRSLTLIKSAESSKGMSSEGCEVKRIQVNSSQQAMDLATQARDQARSDYLQCLGPAEVGQAALADAADEMERVRKESLELFQMNELVLQMLGREAQSTETVRDLYKYTGEEANNLQKEIDRLKASIRTEKRKFLDASPSTSPAVGGLYYTQTPDNKLLIAFLSCFGAFLVFVSIAVMANMIPVDYFLKLSSGERVKIVAAMWVLSLVAVYAGFYLFT